MLSLHPDYAVQADTSVPASEDAGDDAPALAEAV